MVCPRDGQGHSWTLCRNYVLSISPNIGQDEKDAPVAGVESTNTSSPAPPVDSEPADAGLSGMVMSSTAGSTPQHSLDYPAALRHATRKTWNTLLWRYQNFCLEADTRPPNIWDAWSSCHIKSVQCFLGKYSVNTLYLFHHVSAKHHSYWH